MSLYEYVGHTEGLWTARDMYDNEGITIHSDGRHIAFLAPDELNEFGMPLVSGEQRSNARLIAASPALLKACLEAEKELALVRKVNNPLVRHHLQLAIVKATAGVR